MIRLEEYKMASEILGDITEIFTCQAIIMAGLRETEDFSQHIKIADGSIDVDIVIGTPREPELVILVTNSSSGKNSLEKFWRNIGEVLEGAKILQVVPKIVEVNLEGEFRKALSKGMTVVADLNVSIVELDMGLQAVQILREIASLGPRAGEVRTQIVKEAISLNPELKRAALDLGHKIIQLRNSVVEPKLKSIKVALDQIPQGKPIGKRDTYLRRGIAKIALLQLTNSVGLKKSEGNWNWCVDPPRFAVALGILTATCGNCRIIDREIVWCLMNFGLKGSMKLADVSIAERKKNWLAWYSQISNDAISDDHKFIVSNFSLLSDSNVLAELLCDSHRNGYKWLFTHIMEVIKSSTGKKQGYGYTALSKDVGYSKGISSGYLKLADWVNGHLYIEHDDQLIVDVASALSSKLRTIGKDKLRQIGDHIEIDYFENLLEQKIVSYWLFEPLRIIIEVELTKEGVEYDLIKKNPTFIGESLNDPTGTAAPTAIVAKNTLIYWNSAYDKGRHHKTKELMGRGLSLRIAWDGSRFLRRASIQKAILVIDGTWEQKQINALSRCGWDEIYYPDEMDQLAKAVV
jgi:hypothetical protein